MYSDFYNRVQPLFQREIKRLEAMMDHYLPVGTAKNIAITELHQSLLYCTESLLERQYAIDDEHQKEVNKIKEGLRECGTIASLKEEEIKP